MLHLNTSIIYSLQGPAACLGGVSPIVNGMCLSVSAMRFTVRHSELIENAQDAYREPDRTTANAIIA